jgi:chromosome segregation ATPase
LNNKNKNFMKYVLERINTVQACDALLAGAKKKKQDLERRVRNLGESLDRFRERLDQVHADSLQLQSSLEAFTGAYGSLSEGKDKVNIKIRIKRLKLQQAMLEKKAMTYNVGALLVKELQYNRLDSQVSALEDYITAIAQRRAALEAPSLRIVQPIVLLRSSQYSSISSITITQTVPADPWGRIGSRQAMHRPSARRGEYLLAV